MKKLVRIDITSDTVCPWCYVGKKNLEKAIDAARDEFDVQVRWHPFLLHPNAPVAGENRLEVCHKKFGVERTSAIVSRLTKVFQDLGLEFKFGGLTGSSLDSHRLIYLAGTQGYDKQNALVGELFHNHFSQEKFINDRKVLIDAADKAGVLGAREFLADPKAGLKEVQDEIKKFGSGVTGVPHFLINGKYELSGAQPPSTFLQAFRLENSPRD